MLCLPRRHRLRLLHFQRYLRGPDEDCADELAARSSIIIVATLNRDRVHAWGLILAARIWRACLLVIGSRLPVEIVFEKQKAKGKIEKRSLLLFFVHSTLCSPLHHPTFLQVQYSMLSALLYYFYLTDCGRRGNDNTRIAMHDNESGRESQRGNAHERPTITSRSPQASSDSHRHLFIVCIIK